MKIQFPSIASMAETYTDLPLPQALDLEWARQFEKSCKSENDLDSEFAKQIDQGNLLRVAWMLEAVCHVPKSSWGIMGPKEAKVPSKTRIACFILRNYNPLQDPQRQIVGYIINKGRVTKDVTEDAIAHTAIGRGHNHLLPHLDVFWPSFGERAIDCNNIEALSYVLRVSDFADEDSKRGFMLSLYNAASEKKNIDALKLLKDTYPLQADDLIKCSRNFANKSMEAAEWFIKAGANPDKVFQRCVETGAFEFADRLLEYYNADLDADDSAALRFCLESRKYDSLEYLADRGADMSKALPLIRNKTRDECTAFERRLSNIFASKAIPKQMVDWYKEDDTTLVREHRTANLSHQTIFFFNEKEVAQSVTNTKTGAQINHKISDFDSFHNRDLLKEAANKLKELGGDPGPESALKSLKQVKAPLKTSQDLQKPSKPAR